ncbi:MAG TPA: prolyl oligopeptidase family serine peptidase [Chthonomonadaceae bacterium]|nr:prolyl oligopeptidase family serine peptidase [Chthonomonadaceae bacterium]
MIPTRRAPALPALSFLLPAAFFLLSFASIGRAQRPSNVQRVHTDLPRTEIPFERLFTQPYLTGSPPSAVRWAKDNRHIAFLWNPEGHRLRDIYVLEVPDGKPIRLTDAAKIPRIARQDDERTEQEKKEEIQYDGGPGAPIWSPDSKTILFGYHGDIFEVPAEGKGPLRRRLMALEGVGQLDYSPDGKWISFARGNVFLLDRQSGDIRQLTTVTKANTSVSGYDWSPDGKNLLISWSDTSSDKTVIIPDYTKETVEAGTRKRGLVGQSENVQKVGIVSVSGDGIIQWVEGLSPHFYNYGADWSEDGQHVALSEMGGDFKSWRLRVFDIKTRRAGQLLEETSTRYMNDWRPVRWSRDGQSLYFGSDRDGWRHIWKIGASGGTPKIVTAGDWDVGGFDRPKYSDDIIYESTEHSPQELRVYRLAPDGKKTEITGPLPITSPTFATGGGLRGTTLSEDGRHAILDAQDRTHPPDIYYAAISDKPGIPKRLTTSALPEFAKALLVTPQEVTFTSIDGKTVHGLLWLPPKMDPGKRYGAVLHSIYADSAKNGWGGLLESYMAAALDLVVLQVDFRSSWGYGADFATGYYRSLGQVDADEAVAAANFLKAQPYVDPARLGIWGWSYGGFLTEMVMFTRPGAFSTGVAVAPVTDWKHYNEWYTRHRLDEPKDAEEAYKKSSPINFANGLQGHLLMIHGMQDDNVLFQDTVQMVQKLIEAGKDFDVAFYPKDNHGISRDDSRVHVFRRIIKYLYMWLG